MVTVVKRGEAAYPAVLREIADPPNQLYVWGDIDSLSTGILIAVVGTRKPTDYGIRVTGRLSADLTAAGVTVVSGLAYGVDTIALTEAITMGAKVVAVIGSGLDRESFYPAANYQLAERIVESGGAVISEYPSGTPPLKQHFPARNRIIAGLTVGTVVIEGIKGSGALITAEHAMEFGREVFGVPGSIFVPEAWAPNHLIKEGAIPITAAADILESLGLTRLNLPDAAVKETSIEDKIYQTLNQQSLSIDELSRQLQLDSQLISSTLTLMEIKGAIKLTPAGKFTRLR